MHLARQGFRVRSLTVGEVIAERQFQISRRSLVRYAGASGDLNEIHYRDDVATEVGLGGVLAHGMLTMGMAIQPVIDWIDDVNRIRDYRVRFIRPVYVDAFEGATLDVSANVGVIDVHDESARIDLTAKCRDAVVLGKAHVWMSLA